MTTAHKTAQEVYQGAVKGLPTQGKLRLAFLILEETTKGEEDTNTSIDYSHEWTDEDCKDITLHSLRYAEQVYPEAENLV